MEPIGKLPDTRTALVEQLGPWLKTAQSDNNHAGGVYEAVESIAGAIPDVVLAPGALDELQFGPDGSPVKALLTFWMLRRAFPRELNPALVASDNLRQILGQLERSLVARWLDAPGLAVAAAALERESVMRHARLLRTRDTYAKGIVREITEGKHMEYTGSTLMCSRLASDLSGKLYHWDNCVAFASSSDARAEHALAVFARSEGAPWALLCKVYERDGWSEEYRPVPLTSVTDDLLAAMEKILAYGAPSAADGPRKFLLFDAAKTDPGIASLDDFYCSVRKLLDERKIEHEAAVAAATQMIADFNAGRLGGLVGRIPDVLLKALAPGAAA